jgi:hypothetical protein
VGIDVERRAWLTLRILNLPRHGDCAQSSTAVFGRVDVEDQLDEGQRPRPAVSADKWQSGLEGLGRVDMENWAMFSSRWRRSDRVEERRAGGMDCDPAGTA